MPSSRTKWIADAVRREMRRAGWGVKSSGWRARSDWRKRAGVSKRTRVEGCGAGESTEEARGRGVKRSKLGVRRRLNAVLLDELDARELSC